METNLCSRRRAAVGRRGARVGTFALTAASVFAISASPARGELTAAPGPCDDLVAYLRKELAGTAPELFADRGLGYRERERYVEDSLTSSWHTQPWAYAGRVTPACRAEIRRGAAPAATAAARALTGQREPGWFYRGRIIACTMQDPASLDEVAAWMTDSDQAEVRAVCASELATWPGAERLRGPILARAVQKPGLAWEIDLAVVAAANVMGSPELREQLVPVLAAAYERHALGYDRLRDAVCTDDAAMSGDRTRACSRLPADTENEWPQSERTLRWLSKGAATAVYAGAITAAAVERHNDTGRAVATGAGVPIGALMGFTIASIALGPPPARDYWNSSYPVGDKVLAAGALCGGAIAGGVLGGLAAHALGASPGARAPVTALALAPVYFATILAFSID